MNPIISIILLLTFSVGLLAENVPNKNPANPSLPEIVLNLKKYKENFKMSEVFTNADYTSLSNKFNQRNQAAEFKFFNYVFKLKKERDTFHGFSNASLGSYYPSKNDHLSLPTPNSLSKAIIEVNECESGTAKVFIYAYGYFQRFVDENGQFTNVVYSSWGKFEFLPWFFQKLNEACKLAPEIKFEKRNSTLKPIMPFICNKTCLEEKSHARGPAFYRIFGKKFKLAINATDPNISYINSYYGRYIPAYSYFSSKKAIVSDSMRVLILECDAKKRVTIFAYGNIAFKRTVKQFPEYHWVFEGESGEFSFSDSFFSYLNSFCK